MVMFEKQDKTEVEIHAFRPVFVRGRRLGTATRRRIRDLVLVLLHSMGMDPEDCAGCMSMALTGRQCRNRLDRIPVTFQSVISKIAREIMIAEHAKGDVPSPPPAERRRVKLKTRIAGHSRQLLLFGDEDAK